MTNRFDYFVVYAAMRTGSNFLEENINEYPGLKSYGEVYNPVFIGGDKKKELLGVTMEQREADPELLLTQMIEATDGLPGFRFFHDHDPRILDKTLNDPRCAKIILTRNPIDSYVSRKIAGVTGQWRLNDMKNAKSAQIEFDRAEFEAHLERLQAFQLLLQRGLQISGQTAFYVAYDDVRDLDVLDGLAAFLGVDHKKDRTTQRTKVQNPSGLEQKVSNFEEMRAEIGKIDRFDLTRTPNFEPRRPASIPNYVAAPSAPLMFQPIKSAPIDRVLAWMAALDGMPQDDLQRDFNQKTLRQWKRQHPGHRCFTVVRHPVERLHQAFLDYILGTAPTTYKKIRQALRQNYKLPLPKNPDDPISTDQYREAFLGFANFVKGNLGGQTGIRVDDAWASQSEIVTGFSRLQPPDLVIREDMLELGLAQLAEQIGAVPPEMPDGPAPSGTKLAEIYDGDVEEAVRTAYQRDYMMFGFKRYKA